MSTPALPSAFRAGRRHLDLARKCEERAVVAYLAGDTDLARAWMRGAAGAAELAMRMLKRASAASEGAS